jgi:hypothetical protein
LAGGFDPIELCHHSDEVIEQETLCTHPLCEARGASGRIDHYVSPESKPMWIRAIVAMLQKVDYPTVSRPVAPSGRRPAKERCAGHAGSLRQHMVESAPVHVPAATPRATQVRVFFGVRSAP